MKQPAVKRGDSGNKLTGRQSTFARTPLRTGAEVRREVARVYLAARRGELDVADASRLANILAILGRMISGDAVEERLQQLEDHLSGKVVGEVVRLDGPDGPDDEEGGDQGHGGGG